MSEFGRVKPPGPTELANLQPGQVKPWVKGKSGNPGGRPKSLPRYRAACRNASFVALKKLRDRLNDPEIETDDLLAIFIALSDRGGHLEVKVEADVDTAKARLILAALALQGLDEEQRKALVEAVDSSE